MYVKLTNGVPEIYTIGQLRRDNPNTSFPKVIPEALLAAYNVYPLVPVDPPAYDHTKNITPATPQHVDGEWRQAWEVNNASPEEVAARIDEQAQAVRSERGYLLSSTDWVIVYHTEKGTNVPLEWEVYRQALRDITAQAGFPFAVEWPVKPE